MQLVVAIRVTSISREGKYGEEAWAPPAADLVGRTGLIRGECVDRPALNILPKPRVAGRLLARGRARDHPIACQIRAFGRSAEAGGVDADDAIGGCCTGHRASR